MKFYTLFITKTSRVHGCKSIFKINFNNYLHKLFNTKDTEHPGFKMLLEKGSILLEAQ